MLPQTEGKGDPQGAIATAVLKKAQQQSQAKGKTLTDRQYADTINAMPEPMQSQYISQFGAPVVGPKDVAEGAAQDEPSIFDSMVYWEEVSLTLQDTKVCNVKSIIRGIRTA